jgi:cation-transporting ATPase 13A2
MALYSIIQFTSVVLLNFNATFLGNWMYLYQDLWVVFPLVILMGRSKAAASLSKKRPSGRLFSPHNLLTIVLHILITAAFQIIMYTRTQKQYWFYDVSNVNNDPLETNTTIFECTIVWIFAEFQYACIALLFTMERKYKQPIYTNWGFMAWWTVTTVTAMLLLFTTQDIMYAFLQILYIPYTWRVEMFWFVLINVACYIMVEIGFGIAKERGLFSMGRQMKKHRVLLKQYKALWAQQKSKTNRSSN